MSTEITTANKLSGVAVGNLLTITTPDTRRWKQWLHKILFMRPPTTIKTATIVAVSGSTQLTIEDTQL